MEAADQASWNLLTYKPCRGTQPPLGHAGQPERGRKARSQRQRELKWSIALALLREQEDLKNVLN